MAEMIPDYISLKAKSYGRETEARIFEKIRDDPGLQGRWGQPWFNIVKG